MQDVCFARSPSMRVIYALTFCSIPSCSSSGVFFSLYQAACMITNTWVEYGFLWIACSQNQHLRISVLNCTWILLQVQMAPKRFFSLLLRCRVITFKTTRVTKNKNIQTNNPKNERILPMLLFIVFLISSFINLFTPLSFLHIHFSSALVLMQH